MQAVIKGRGGTIEAHFLGARPTSCTVSVYTDTGAAKVDGATATVSTVNTTISAGAARGATSVTLASASGVVAGRRYLLGTLNSTEAAEAVTVKSVSGSAATLWAPLMLAHSSGVSFSGTRVSYAVSASAADAYWFDGYSVWTPDAGDEVTETVDCVRRLIPVDLISEVDVRAVFPKAPKILDAELDMCLALREARDEYLRIFGGKNRAFTALGSDNFRRPTALTFWLLRRHSMGDEWAETMDRMEQERDVITTKMQSQTPFDNDQDGTTSSQDDGGFTVITLERA